MRRGRKKKIQKLNYPLSNSWVWVQIYVLCWTLSMLRDYGRTVSEYEYTQKLTYLDLLDPGLKGSKGTKEPVQETGLPIHKLWMWSTFTNTPTHSLESHSNGLPMQ
jgi:hypothetical protein